MKKALLFSVVIIVALVSCNKSLKSVKIGNQVWTTENLNIDHFQNGDIIPEAKTDADWQNASNTGKPAWCFYNNSPDSGASYGRMYNWYAVNDPRGLAPKGWHVPTTKEWADLSNFLGGRTIAGGKMKSMTNWGERGNGTNESGFSALPSGRRYILPPTNDGPFFGVGHLAEWWCSDTSSAQSVEPEWTGDYGVGDFDGMLMEGAGPKGFGVSVRLVKDDQSIAVANNNTKPEVKESKPTTTVQRELSIYLDKSDYQEYIANRSHTLSGFYIFKSAKGVKACYFRYDGDKTEGNSIVRFTNNEITPLSDFKLQGSNVSFSHRVVYFGEQKNCPYVEYVNGVLGDRVKANVTIKNPCSPDRQKQTEWLSTGLPEVDYDRTMALKEFIVNSENKSETARHTGSTKKSDIKPVDEAKLMLTDGSVKKAKLYLGTPDKQDNNFGHWSKGYMVYLNRVSGNGAIKHLILFTRINGDFWGDDAKIEEIFSVDDNEKACFGIHCLTIRNGQLYSNVAGFKGK